VLNIITKEKQHLIKDCALFIDYQKGIFYLFQLNIIKKGGCFGFREKTTFKRPSFNIEKSVNEFKSNFFW